MTAVPVRVVKVGGSLFDFPQLVPSLERFLGCQSPAATVMVCGGGPWADAVRDVADRYRIGEPAAHDLCIRAMGVTARLLAVLSSRWQLEPNWQRLVSWTRSADAARQVRVLDPGPFLQDVEPRLPGRPLPHEWRATSDSIAARVARALEAQELVLLKSAGLTEDTSLAEAAARGYVDPFFPHAADCLPRVRCVNLRDPQAGETVWVREKGERVDAQTSGVLTARGFAARAKMQTPEVS